MLTSLGKAFLGSANGTANSFGFKKIYKGFKEQDTATCRSMQAKIFERWDDFSSQRKTAEQPIV